MRDAKFTISIHGSGRLLSSFITDGFQRWKNAEMYDQSGKTTEFRKSEAALGESGYLNKEGREAAKRIRKDLNSSPKRDMEVHFTMKGEVQEVEVRLRGGRLTRHRFNLHGTSLEDIDRANLKIILAVENLLEEKHKSPRRAPVVRM